MSELYQYTDEMIIAAIEAQAGPWPARCFKQRKPLKSLAPAANPKKTTPVVIPDPPKTSTPEQEPTRPSKDLIRALCREEYGADWWKVSATEKQDRMKKAKEKLIQDTSEVPNPT